MDCELPMIIVRRIVVVGYSTAVVLSNISAAAQPANWEIGFSPLCVEIANEFECARAIERSQLPDHHHVARRSGDTLSVAGPGSRIQFVDTIPKSGGYEEAVYTSFLHFFPQPRLALVHQMADEYAHLLLIDIDLGTSAQLLGSPQMSSDGAHFVVATDDDYLDHNVLQLWSTKPLEIRWKVETRLWRFHGTVWRDSSTVEVIRAPTADAKAEAEERILPSGETIRLVKTMEGWKPDVEW